MDDELEDAGDEAIEGIGQGEYEKILVNDQELAEIIKEKKVEYDPAIDKEFQDGARRNMGLLSRTCRHAVHNDDDVFVGVTGDAGMGKSSFCYDLGRMISGKKFNIKQNYFFSTKYEDIKPKFFEVPEFQCLIFDEGGNTMYRRNWQSKLQRKLNEFYMTNRKFHRVTLSCMLRFQDFEDFLKSRMGFNVHVFARGYAAVFCPLDSTGLALDKWNLKMREKSINNLLNSGKLQSLTFEQKVGVYRKVTNFMFFVKFNAMPPEAGKDYNDAIVSFAKEQEGGDDDNSTTFLARALIVLADREGYKHTELAKLVGVTQQHVSKIMSITRERDKTPDPKKAIEESEKRIEWLKNNAKLAEEVGKHERESVETPE